MTPLCLLRRPPTPLRRRIRVAATVVAAALACPAWAQAERPKIGLVLSGGGARGAAHIGVLETLERLHVPVDCIAGTSFGALVAGAWAAGVSPATMRQAMSETNWPDMFQDNPDYRELDQRYKHLLKRYLPGTETGVGPDGLTYSGGAVSGQKIKLFINRLVHADRGEPDIGALPVPLSIIATDIGTGERVVFRDGNLTQAMRASMSVPGLVAPAEIDGRKLVDGGLVDNLPIQEVRDRCGAERVIAVNVGSPLLAPQSVGSLLTVSAQMVALLTEQNVTRSLALLRPGDIYMRPELTGLTAGDFVRFEEIIERGRTAADWSTEALRALAVDDATWAGWLAQRRAADRRRPWVESVQVEPLNHVAPEALTRHITQAPDTPLEPAELQRDLMRAFGDGWYESVDYRLDTVRDRYVLRVLPVEKPWGPDYLRFGVNFDSTLSQGSTFSLRAAYQRTWLNRLGGELLFTGEIGTESALGVQWYQPLEPSQRWFAQLDLSGGTSDIDIFNDQQRVAVLALDRAEIHLAGGLNLPRLGQLRLGWRASAVRATVDVGPDSIEPGSDHVRGPTLAVQFDQLNRLYFPTDGWAVNASYFHSREGGFARAAADLRGAYSLGDWVLGGRLAYVGSTHGRLPISEAATLGGFLNLSAYGHGQLLADTTRYGHVRAERIIGRLPLGLRGDMRLGAALELGSLGNPYAGVRSTELLTSLALYLGGETPFGPVYLGFGQGKAGATNAYLFLGTP